MAQGLPEDAGTRQEHSRGRPRAVRPLKKTSERGTELSEWTLAPTSLGGSKGNHPQPGVPRVPRKLSLPWGQVHPETPEPPLRSRGQTGDPWKTTSPRMNLGRATLQRK